MRYSYFVYSALTRSSPWAKTGLVQRTPSKGRTRRARGLVFIMESLSKGSSVVLRKKGVRLTRSRRRGLSLASGYGLNEGRPPAGRDGTQAKSPWTTVGSLVLVRRSSRPF